MRWSRTTACSAATSSTASSPSSSSSPCARPPATPTTARRSRACTTAARRPTPAAASAVSPAGRRPAPPWPTARSASQPAGSGQRARASTALGMTTDFHSQRVDGPHPGSDRPALRAILEARSVALVGASKRPDSFGARMLAEVVKSPARPTIYPVTPRSPEIDGRRCYPSLADLPEPADLVLLGVPDAAVEGQLTTAAEQGCRSAVIFGNAHEDPAPQPSDPARSGPGSAAALPGPVLRPAPRQRLGPL